MKAIQVKFLPATNTKPARLKAMAEGVKSIVESYNYEGAEIQASALAYRLAAKYGWAGELVEGGLPDGSWAFCFAPINRGSPDTIYVSAPERNER